MCTHHISCLDAVAVVSHIFCHSNAGDREAKEKFFSGIFNKECDREKFMLERIIKNNYRNEKNMFFRLHRQTPPISVTDLNTALFRYNQLFMISITGHFCHY